MIGAPVAPEDLHSEPYFRDPFPVWERLRHEQPLFHDTVDDRWLLTRYDDVVSVFRDHGTYSTLPYKRIFSDVIGPTMVQMDGPDHDVRRAIVAPELVGRKLEKNFQPLVEEVVAELIAGLPGEGELELVERFTRPLPLKVVATILGMPPGADAFLADTTQLIIEALAGREPARARGIEAHQRLAARIDRLISDRMEQPSPDLVSGIAHGQTERGERLSRQEIASFISLLLVAGGETTDRALANFVYILIQHPDALDEVAREPALLEPAFTEFMRRDGVVVYEDRELTADVEWYGQGIRAGEIVRVALISANNDETVFADPRRFDVRRDDLRLGKESRHGGGAEGLAGHVGFGVGKHFCIGYQLARAEVVTGVRQLLATRGWPRFVAGAEPRLRVDWFHRHLDRLPVVFAP